MSESDREKWRGRINRAYMESRVGTEAAGLAILAGIVDGFCTDLSNLMEAQLKAIDEATQELRHIRRRLR
jgi:hypothetical protein